MSRVLSITCVPHRAFSFPNFGICMHAVITSLHPDTGLESWAHSDPRLVSWSLCVGLSTLAFQATKSGRARRRRTKRRGGTDRRIARFMEREGQSLQNIRRSAIPKSRAGGEDLVILPRDLRAHRAAKERGKSIVRDRNTNMKMSTEPARGIVLHTTSKNRRFIAVQLSQVASTHPKRLC